MINALRYLMRSGCGWRMLPNGFPSSQTVYYWFRRLTRCFLFETIHDLALMLDRMCEQHESFPRPALSIASQSRHQAHVSGAMAPTRRSAGVSDIVAVDTDSRLLALNLTTADIADSTGPQLVLDALVKRCPWVSICSADAAYDRRTLLDKAAFLNFTVEVVRGLQGQDGFRCNHDAGSSNVRLLG